MKNALVLFDLDLRISDNPAFFAALQNNDSILPLYIFDEVNKRPLGEASKWFLHYALQSFSKLLKKKYELNLVQKKGDSLKILREILASKKISAIYFNRLVEPYNIKLHDEIKKLAEEKNIAVFDFISQTLFNPNEIKTTTKSYFKVYTPFWRHCLKKYKEIGKVLPAPKGDFNQLLPDLASDDLNLLPKKNWAKKFEKIWEFDDKKFREKLSTFLEKQIHDYFKNRDIPSIHGTTTIAPYLHFGLISIREIFDFTLMQPNSAGQQKFLSSLMWREFGLYLLYHFPQMAEKNFNSYFDNFAWQENHELFEKWKKGQTGYPIVDAAMREIWATGFMHNRPRMIVASFLVKHLLIDWREGEKYFWDCLLDADLANNSMNWQWVAGSGVDAAPYYRIFNPSRQSVRFDPKGNYIKKWVPELKNMPDKLIHSPWEVDAAELKKYDVVLGKTYPKPIIDHTAARDMALTLYRLLRH